MASGRGAHPSLALALVGVGMLLAVGYPLAAGRAVAAFGSRPVGGVVLALGLASVLLSRRSRIPGVGLWLRGLPLALPALALATGDVRFLRLVPAAIELVLCGLFLGSLRGGRSILEQAARVLEPYAPDFIGPYCRKVTAAFAALFLAQALALAVLSFAAEAPDWVRDASVWVWAPTLAGMLVEFVARKVWFRHYGPGLVDRALRVCFPPENTEQGRRSLDWIRRKRAELGMPPP